jgi:hypothetical protein
MSSIRSSVLTCAVCAGILALQGCAVRVVSGPPVVYRAPQPEPVVVAAPVEVTFEAQPQVEVIGTTQIEWAPGYHANVFRYGGVWYWNDGPYWYTTRVWGQPWGHVAAPPRAFLAIPPNHHAYEVVQRHPDNPGYKTYYEAHRPAAPPPPSRDFRTIIKPVTVNPVYEQRREEDRKRAAAAEDARRHKEAEEADARKRHEADEARKMKEAEDARRHKEAEETDARKRHEADEARKMKEAEDARRHKEAEEADARKHKEAEEADARKHKEAEEADARKRKEAEDARKHQAPKPMPPAPAPAPAPAPSPAPKAAACKACNGTGKIGLNVVCPACKGTGIQR